MQKSSYSKKIVVHLTYSSLQHHITKTKTVSAFDSDLFGLDIPDLEEALVEDGGVPLCNPVSITPDLHEKPCQFQLKKSKSNRPPGGLLTKFAVHV